MISSQRSDARWRLRAAGLFAAFMAASALTNHGLTPVTGSAPTPRSVSDPADRGAALLLKAPNRFDQVTFCDPQKAYAPDRIQLGMGGLSIETAPYRPVIVCSAPALDLPKASARARRDHLVWTRHIAGTDLIVFAADEASFQRAMAGAGLRLSADDLPPFSPLLAQLHSNVAGASTDLDGWSLPAHPDDGLLLFGPYVPLSGGDYVVRIHGRFDGAPGRCAVAMAAFRPSLSATAEVGKTTLIGRSPASIVSSPNDPCAFTVSSRFTVGAAGAQNVETPFYANPAQPVLIDGYDIEPAAPAQSR